MANKTTRRKCPKCGAKVNTTYEAPYQEYAGASAQGGYYYHQCSKCGWEDTVDDIGDFSFRENTRGW